MAWGQALRKGLWGAQTTGEGLSDPGPNTQQKKGEPPLVLDFSNKDNVETV